MAKYSEDGHLAVLTNEILSTYKGPELGAAGASRYKILFTESSLGDEEIAGKCRKMDGAVRYLYDLDYLILIHKPTFDSMTALEKTRILVHELHHIDADEDKEPLIRH